MKENESTQSAKASPVDAANQSTSNQKGIDYFSIHFDPHKETNKEGKLVTDRSNLYITALCGGIGMLLPSDRFLRVLGGAAGVFVGNAIAGHRNANPKT